jgi:hypothetical protein
LQGNGGKMETVFTATFSKAVRWWTAVQLPAVRLNLSLPQTGSGTHTVSTGIDVRRLRGPRRWAYHPLPPSTEIKKVWSFIPTPSYHHEEYYIFRHSLFYNNFDRRFRGTYFLHHQSDDLMMEAVSTSETSVNFNVTTRRYIPEGSKLHTRRRKNLKSHKMSRVVH